MRPRRALKSAVLALAVVLASHAARASVRVEEDEVVFTHRAPGATDVYLVGDFNRWNPTVERMDGTDGVFEVRLFLVAGEYRYKFVVDGVWTVDPDNPGGDKGSPLKLVERSGGLILETEAAGETAPVAAAHTWLRYIGALRGQDGDSDIEERVDAGIGASYDRLSARARVATHDSLWAGSPARMDVFFDRGKVDVAFGHITVRGLENDSAWTSSDPMALVGNEGVYRYDAGFRRHGVAAMTTGSRGGVRVLYADATSRTARAPVRIPAAVLSDFAAGAAPDTAVYAYTSTFDDADVIAVDANASMGAVDAGLAYREDRGVNPGVRASVARVPGGFTTTLDATREDRRVSAAWIRFHAPAGMRVTGGFGWGESDVRSTARASLSGTQPVEIDASRAADAIEARAALMDTRRGVVRIEGRAGDADMALCWDLTRFDFDGVEGVSSADVHRASARVSMPWGAWSLRAGVTYTHADYGGAPDPLYIDWPERNPWLSQWDAVDAASMVGLGLDAHDVLVLDARRDGDRAVGGEVVLEARGVAEALVHASTRAWLEARIARAWSARLDGRWAWYRDGQGDTGGSYLSGYAEAGYVWNRVSIDLGFGFDPVVFDPVVGDYADIGRGEYLRSAIAGGVRRSEATELFQRLQHRESALEGEGVIKLECVVRLE